jgi:putative restriction endonuclease
LVQLYVANTDSDWFDFLSAQPGVDEVNFWQPGGKLTFRALRREELFCFRLKSTRNAIGGFGQFDRSSNVPISLAWEAFGVKNGAPTLEAMRKRVGQYRSDGVTNEDYTIGCRILLQPTFLPPEKWLPQPASFSRSIVGGKTYSTDEAEGRELWEALMGLADITALRAPGFAEDQRRFGEPALIKPRLGQGAFRIAVTDAYQRACAVSRGKVLPALEAAHIRPYAAGGTHEISNGILLRRDIHSIFDAGYVTVDCVSDEKFKFVVSDRVRVDFNNGEEYRKLHGATLFVPQPAADQPDRAALRWHNEEKFLG